MQDDVYQVADDGWKAVSSMDEKKKTWDCDLFPKYLVINKFFQTEQAILKNWKQTEKNLKQQLPNSKKNMAGKKDYLLKQKMIRIKLLKPVLRNA